jgi:hypothetical protein
VRCQKRYQLRTKLLPKTSLGLAPAQNQILPVF